MTWVVRIPLLKWAKPSRRSCKSKCRRIFIHEVGPRDGLQVENLIVPLEEKIRWIENLLASGIDLIQLGSFVHPEKVPQMADTDALFRYFTAGKPAQVTLSGLVLNQKGLERGLACGVEMFCMGVSASETHSRKNTGMTTTEALRQIIAMARQALAEGKKFRLRFSRHSAAGLKVRLPRGKFSRLSNPTWRRASKTSAWLIRLVMLIRSRLRNCMERYGNLIHMSNWLVIFTTPMAWG